MIGGTRSCRGRQTPHATAPAEQRHHHATGIRRSRRRRTRREAGDYDHGERLTDQTGRIRRNRFLRGQYSKFCRNPLAFLSLQDPIVSLEDTAHLPTRGAYKSCETYSLRDAGLDACAWDPRSGWMTLTILCVAHPQWEAFAHRGVQAAAPKPPSRPHTLWKGCSVILSHEPAMNILTQPGD